ncbi:iron ABC transporter permease [Bacteroidales bacterium MB20-C3-3]|nr:iron ABC transporter permease [Bacteroidales bacterium MB20-C3-3]
MRPGKSYFRIYAAIAVSLVVLIIMNLILGSVIIPVRELFASITNSSSISYVNDILWNFRIPKVITALLAGVALSVCGLQMQTLFRNPLADPFILGISSGAGLGVALFVMGSSAFGITMAGSIFFNLGIAAAAWAGAAGVTLLILLVSHRLKENSSLLIFGIMIGSITSAIITLIQYFSSSSELKAFVTWTMGSFSGLTSAQIWIMSMLVFPGIVLSVYNIKELNILLQGEAYAKSLGLNLERTRRRILIATTLLAGSITAFCGPIGFIGIAVPHIARLLFRNADHKVLVPATALTGAAIMVFTDMVAQLPGQSGVIPINTVSALIGVPVILYLIMKSRFA